MSVLVSSGRVCSAYLYVRPGSPEGVECDREEAGTSACLPKCQYSGRHISPQGKVKEKIEEKKYDLAKALAELACR